MKAYTLPYVCSFIKIKGNELLSSCMLYIVIRTLNRVYRLGCNVWWIVQEEPVILIQFMIYVTISD